jgi:hypothetical protein
LTFTITVRSTGDDQVNIAIQKGNAPFTEWTGPLSEIIVREEKTDKANRFRQPVLVVSGKTTVEFPKLNLKLLAGEVTLHRQPHHIISSPLPPN